MATELEKTRNELLQNKQRLEVKGSPCPEEYLRGYLNGVLDMFNGVIKNEVSV